LIHIEKWYPERPISAVYYDAEKDMYYVKRFLIETRSEKRTVFISESEGSRLEAVSTAYEPTVKIEYNKRLRETKNLPDKEVRMDEFIDVKGMKSQGNQLTKLKVKEITLVGPIGGNTPWPEVEKKDTEAESNEDSDNSDDDDELGDSEEGPVEVEWDLSSDTDKKEEKPKKGNPIKDEEDDSQASLF
jgi:topoisomerase-4 subunit A